jgi:hypothetical protein
MPSCGSSRHDCSVLMARRYSSGETISSAAFLHTSEVCTLTSTATAASRAALCPILAGTSWMKGPKTDIRCPVLPVVVAAIRARASCSCCDGDGCLRKGDLGGLRLTELDREDFFRGVGLLFEILNLWVTDPLSANFSFNCVSCRSC